MKKVLAVEDKVWQQEMWQNRLKGKLVLLSAFSIQEAEDQFAANPDIAAIVMDACVPGSRPTTIPLVKKFRVTFKGPMIAASSLSCYRQDLMLAGCDYEAEKGEVPEKLLEVLSLG